MSEETQAAQAAPETPEPQAKAAAQTQPPTQAAQPAQTQTSAASHAEKAEKVVPYARFQEVVNARNDLAAELKKIQDAQLATEKTFGDLRAQFEQTQAELNMERLARLRVETAARKGLPLELAPRLSGSNAQELEADAETLLQFVKAATPQTPGVPPPARGTASKLDLRSMSPAEIREKRNEIMAGRS